MSDVGAAPDPGFSIPGYTDIRQIGRGGFSTVYYAVQSQFERVVAVKVLDIGLDDERTKRQYQRECAATGRLSGHPNIVSIIDSGFTSQTKPYLTMDYCSQGSLGDRVAAFGPLPVHEVLRIGVKIGGALESAHQKDILHRDIKPENILVSGYGEPGLADFGIATVTARLQSSVTIHAMTPNHAPPEVMEGKAATELSDVYSLGSTLYELLAGRPAFNLGNDNSILAFLIRVLQEPVPPIPRQDVVPVVHDVLAAMMAKDPGSRYQSAGAAAVALQQLQAHLGYPVTELVTFNPVPGALSESPGGMTAGRETAHGVTGLTGGMSAAAAVVDAFGTGGPTGAADAAVTVPPMPTPMPVAPPPAPSSEPTFDDQGNATVLRPGAALAGPAPGSVPTPVATAGPAPAGAGVPAPPPPDALHPGELSGSETIMHGRHAPAIESIEFTPTPEEKRSVVGRVLVAILAVVLIGGLGYVGYTKFKGSDTASPGTSTTTTAAGTGTPASTTVTTATPTASGPSTTTDPLDTTPVTTGSSTPMGPPTDVTIAVTGPDSVQVTWRDPNGGRSPYVYQVFSPDGKALSKTNSHTGTSTSLIITKTDDGPLVTDGTTYCVAIGAIVGAGKPAYAPAACTDGTTLSTN